MTELVEKNEKMCEKNRKKMTILVKKKKNQKKDKIL